MKKERIVLRYSLLLFILACSNIYVAAQKLPVNWTYINLDQGLSSTMVRCFMEDRDGFMWIGTENGLNRFDGNEFKIYGHNTNDSTSIGDNNIWCMMQDIDGNIWFGTYSGFSIYNPRKDQFKTFTTDKTDSIYRNMGTVKHIMQNSKGQIWMGGASSSIRLCDTAGIVTTYRLFEQDFSNPNAEVVLKIIEDPQDNNLLWVLHEYSISLIDISNLDDLKIKSNIHRENGTNKIKFDDFIIDQDGNIWVIGKGIGLGKYSNGKFDWYKYDQVKDESLYTNMLTSISQKSATELWLASYNHGLMKFDMNTNTFHYHQYNYEKMDPENPSIDMISLYTDSNENVWTNYDNGIAILGKKNNSIDHGFLMKKYNLPSDITYLDVMHDTIDNVMYFLGTDNGIHRLDLKNNQLKSSTKIHKRSEKISTLFDIKKTSKEEIWVASCSYFSKTGLAGLFKYNATTNSFIPIEFNGDPEYFIGKDMSTIIIDDHGIVWATAFHNALYKFDLNYNTCKEYKYDDEKWRLERAKIIAKKINTKVDTIRTFPISKFILDSTKDKNGRIWYSSGSGITAFIPKEEYFIRVVIEKTKSPTLNNNNTKSLVVDDSNNLYVGTVGGGVNKVNLNDIENTPFEKYTLEEGMLNNNIWWLDMDGLGNIWAGSSSGLNIINPISNTIKSFTKNDGLFDNNITEIKYSSYDAMLVGSEKNISSIQPSIILAKDRTPKTLISDFKVFNEHIDLEENIVHTKNIKLNYDQNFISFTYTATEFINTKKINYAYQLIGIDDKWNEVGNTRSASYNSLAPGKYTFKVKAQNADGVWSAEPTLLNIDITPPLWGTTWFRILALSITSMLIISLYNWRIRNIKNKAALEIDFKQRISDVELKALRSQMNPHFLFNSLNAIKFYMIKKGSDEAIEYLSDFAQLVRMILNFSDQSFISLKEDTDALDLYINIERRRFNDEFEYELFIDPKIKLESFQIPPMLIQPYVENAIWHGLMHKKNGVKKLKVSLTQKENGLNIKIADNGVGRKVTSELNNNSAKKHKSKGMKITQDRMELSQLNNKILFDVQISDLLDSEGLAAGTEVNIFITPEKMTT